MENKEIIQRVLFPDGSLYAYDSKNTDKTELVFIMNTLAVLNRYLKDLEKEGKITINEVKLEIEKILQKYEQEFSFIEDIRIK